MAATAVFFEVSITRQSDGTYTWQGEPDPTAPYESLAECLADMTQADEIVSLDEALERGLIDEDPRGRTRDESKMESPSWTPDWFVGVDGESTWIFAVCSRRGTMNLSFEYNEYVIGYVVTDSETGRSLNFQFEKIQSNHPTPDFQLFAGCEGDTTHEAFTEEEVEEAREWLRGQKGVKELEDAFTAAYYADPDFLGTGEVQEWEILDASERVRD